MQHGEWIGVRGRVIGCTVAKSCLQLIQIVTPAKVIIPEGGGGPEELLDSRFRGNDKGLQKLYTFENHIV